MNDQTTLQYKWSNKVTYGTSGSHGAVAQLDDTRLGLGTFVTLKGACGKQQPLENFAKIANKFLGQNFTDTAWIVGPLEQAKRIFS